MNDIKALNEMLQTSREMFEETKKMSFDQINSFGFNDSFRDSIESMNDEEIENLTLKDIEELLEKHGIDKTDIELLYSKSFEKDKPYLTFIKNRIHETKNMLNDIKKESEELEDLEKQMKTLKEDFINYVRSPEYKELKMEHIKKLKKLCEEETDEVKKNKYLKKLEVIENIESSKFLLERFEKLGKKEVESNFKTFFDNAKSEYLMRKWVSTCKRLKLSDKLYQYFFNIEENHLPKEYHVFNNLFLFICIRFISYCNPDIDSDRMYVVKTINNLAHLIYHDFANNEEEQEFLNLIMKIEDYFEEYRDYFEENNTTHPNHPLRIKAMEEFKANKKKDLIGDLLKNEDNELSEEELASKEYEELVTLREEIIAKNVNESNNAGVPVTSGYVAIGEVDENNSEEE